uniref:Uncharacterized protein n=1 Tax=Rhabditophanes sp. KR3021 TaxID=114890 RepID=A0AC35TQA5_9BILA
MVDNSRKRDKEPDCGLGDDLARQASLEKKSSHKVSKPFSSISFGDRTDADLVGGKTTQKKDVLMPDNALKGEYAVYCFIGMTNEKYARFSQHKSEVAVSEFKLIFNACSAKDILQNNIFFPYIKNIEGAMVFQISRRTRLEISNRPSKGTRWKESLIPNKKSCDVYLFIIPEITEAELRRPSGAKKHVNSRKSFKFT